MNEIQPMWRTLGVRVAMMFGLAAAAAMVALGVGHGGAVVTGNLAGSGDAPANTTYQQPAVGGMNMGATATWEPPATTEIVSKAVPPLKAG